MLQRPRLTQEQPVQTTLSYHTVLVQDSPSEATQLTHSLLMSSPPTAEGTQLSGLGRSTPLVTFSNVHSGIRTVTSERMAPVSAGSDHPLAGPGPVPTNHHPRASVELSPQVTPSPKPAALALAIASPPPPPPPVPAMTRTTPPKAAAQATAPTVAKLLPPAVKKPPAISLDEMADEFLSQPSPRTEAGLPPLLKPTPLPKGESGIVRLRTLVVRRAWGDVMQVCADMLRGATSPYTPLYASLVRHDALEEEEQQQQQVPPQAMRDETIEILTWECHAWLHLRRYAELGREIDRWNFLSHNDSSATSPSWVPWSLRKCSLLRVLLVFPMTSVKWWWYVLTFFFFQQIF